LNPQPRFHDAGAAAWAAIAALGAGLVLDAYAASYVALHFSELAATPGKAWASLHMVVRLATLITFVVWTERVYANLDTFEHQPEHSRLWAVLAFFVPPFFLFRPCQIVLETWRASATQHASSSMPAWIVSWWVALMTPPAVLMFSMTAPRDVATRNFLIAHLLNCVAAGMAMYVVLALTRQQRVMKRWLERVAFEEERRARINAMPAAAPAPAPVAPVLGSAAVPAADTAASRRRLPEAAARTPPHQPARTPALRTGQKWLATRSASVWRDASAWITIALAFLTAIAGARIVAQSPARGVVHFIFGALLFGAWMLLRRTRVAQSENHRWAMLAAAGALMALMNLLTLAASGAEKAIPKPRPLSDAERAAVATVARFTAVGPSGVWDDLATNSPIRKLGKARALHEIEARLGPHDDANFVLQTVVPSLRDKAAAFGMSFSSGVDDSVVFEMVKERERWAIRTIRTSGEPAVPVAALAPRTRVDESPALLEGIDLRVALAAALPAAFLTILALGILRARRAIAIVFASVAAIGVVASAAIVAVLAFPLVARKEVPPLRVPDFVPLADVLPLRRALAKGDLAGVNAQYARLKASDTRDVATLWKLQLELLNAPPADPKAKNPHRAIDRAIAELRWRAQTPLAHLLRARAAFLDKRMAETVLAYESAIGTGPGRDALWLEVATTLSVLGFEDRANHYLRLAAETGSREPSVYYYMAMFAALDGNTKRAEKLFLSGWKMQPLPKGDALSMAMLWEVFRQPDVTNVLRLQIPDEARFASPARAPIALASVANAEVVGDCMLVRAGRSKLLVPGGASIAPVGSAIEDAKAWERREEQEVLAEYESLRTRAATSAALADPQLRDRITAAADALARHNRWNDVLALTDTLAAGDERVPIEVMVIRGHALKRAKRDGDVRRLILDLLKNPAVRRRRDPIALMGVAELLASIDVFDPAIGLLQRVRGEMEIPGIEQRIQQLEIEKALSTSYAVVKTDHFDIHYPPHFPKEFAEKAGAILEAELVRLRREWLPGSQLRRTRVNLLWWEDFRDYSGSDFIAGLYTDEIFLPFAGVGTFIPEIVAIMSHELFHAMLANATNDLAPRWFHEAFASRVEMEEVTRNAFQRYGDHRLLSVALLDDVANNSPDPELIGSAYSIGESTLRFIEAKWGRAGIQRLVRAFAEGRTTEEAVMGAFGISVAELDRLARAWGVAQPPLFTNNNVIRYDDAVPQRGTFTTWD
jgi:hypothetical protein